jgi:hypothetical protein
LTDVENTDSMLGSGVYQIGEAQAQTHFANAAALLE